MYSDSLYFIVICWYVFGAGDQAQALHMLGKFSTAELYSQPSLLTFLNTGLNPLN